MLTKCAYKALVSASILAPVIWRKKNLWRSSSPLKVKGFVWLELKDIILVWENLKKRRVSGPSFCVLCGANEEMIDHLLVNCSFVKVVWMEVCYHLNLYFQWTK